MIKTLTFGNVSLSDYSCYYDGSQMWKKPQRNFDLYNVPGKNGDLAIDMGNYSNVSRSFNCFINKNFSLNYSSLIDALTEVQGYQRFECSEEPDVFMLALFKDQIEPDMWQFNTKGTFTLNFDFKPQKWLKMGENAIDVTNLTLINPTHQLALPLLECVGTGSITINDSVLTLAANTSTTYIDCEIQDCYEGTLNRNGDLTIVNGFPVLTDSNTISMAGFTSVKLYPRWWRL